MALARWRRAGEWGALSRTCRIGLTMAEPVSRSGVGGIGAAAARAAEPSVSATARTRGLSKACLRNQPRSKLKLDRRSFRAGKARQHRTTLARGPELHRGLALTEAEAVRLAPK